MTYNIFTKAQQMLKDRENYYGEQAHMDGLSYATQCGYLDRAGAYNSAWWILQYALEENWEALEQMDYYHTEEDEE